jgi:hypothetical protein
VDVREKERYGGSKGDIFTGQDMLNSDVEWVKERHLKAAFGARKAWMLDRLVGLGKTVRRCGLRPYETTEDWVEDVLGDVGLV